MAESDNETMAMRAHDLLEQEAAMQGLTAAQLHERVMQVQPAALPPLVSCRRHGRELTRLT